LRIAGLEAEIAFFESRNQRFQNRDGIPQFRSFEIAHFDAQTRYYQSLMEAHLRRMDWDKTVEFGELAFGAEEATWDIYSAEADEDTEEYQTTLASHRVVKLGMLQAMLSSRQSADDVIGTIGYAERVLDLDPGNLPTLITIARTTAQRPPVAEEDLDSSINVAEGYARAAVESFDVLLNSATSDQIGDEQKAMLMSTVHSTLGLVHSRQQDYDSAEREYRLALNAVPRDPTTLFRLGLTYANTDNADDALSALARAVFIEPAFPAARQSLERVYELEHGSLDGLDEFVIREGQEIAAP